MTTRKRIRPGDLCSVVGCNSQEKAKGWCNAHYLRAWNHGDPLVTRLRNIEKRFWQRLILDGECWIWPGATNRQGYGRIRHEGALVATHRLAYTLMVATIPEGLTIDHLCRQVACCNPYHMDPVPLAINNERAIAARHQERTCAA